MRSFSSVTWRNGKTTLARLLAAQLAPMEGAINASSKMRVGYFTQYQVEELHGDGQTIVLVTHEADIAAHARRRITLRDGVIERDEAQHAN